MTGTRGLKAGDLVLVPASYRQTAVVETVALNGLSFTDTSGSRHFTADAELVPAVAPVGPSRAWADLTALPTADLRAMAASGMLTAAEQWGTEDELGERDDPFETPEQRAARLYPGIAPDRRPVCR
jgi:hypothetical protein